MKPKVYIDGQAGTTGLQIYDRLAERTDIELLLIDAAKRKDNDERKKLMNAADIVFLCLPDAAAAEAVKLVENPNTRIIDTSTAHRTAPGWDYGFPELSQAHKDAIRKSKRVANPGCHATGFISIVYPLIASKAMGPCEFLTCFSLTGYSGGGKQMIAEYENPNRNPLLGTPALYALNQDHKHLPEMQKICGQKITPIFVPIVDDYYKGMAVTVPLFREHLDHVYARDGEEVWETYVKHYGKYKPGRVVYTTREPAQQEIRRIYAGKMAGKDSLEILVYGNPHCYTVTALFDNLGKGASGAAVQNMNLMLGFEETAGLNLE